MNSDHKWHQLVKLSKEKQRRRKKGPSGLSPKQEEFCVRYVYGGEFLTLKEWSKRFCVTVETLYRWMCQSKIKEFLQTLRDERRLQIADNCMMRVGSLMKRLEEVAGVDPSRVVFQGRGKNKVRLKVTDPDLLDKKIQAVEAYMRILTGNQKEEKGASALIEINNANSSVLASQSQAMPPSLVGASAHNQEELSLIEQELKELKALNADEKLIEGETE